jgi:hypothetical protein
MLRGGRQRNLERLRQFADRALATRKGVQHAPTRAVAKRVKDRVHLLCV